MENQIEKTLEDRAENIVPEKTTAKQTFWELVRFAIIALLVVIPIRLFIAEPFIVSGSSMVPTFENGDYLIIDKISYNLVNPKRNDVVVFRDPNEITRFFVKRIIGLPGETVNIKGSVVTIKNEANKEGFVLDQPYVKSLTNNSTNLKLENDEYFVMGDNRNASSDSRHWGAVNENLLTGKPFIRLWPINKIDISPGSYSQEK